MQKKELMNYNIEEYKLEDNFKKLNLKLPNKISFFPENIETANNKEDFIFTETIIELNKYFEIENLKLDLFGGDTELYRSRKNADIYLPTIFFSLTAISQNPELISVSLNIVSSFLYDALKGTIGKKTAHIEFHFESKEKGKMKKIDYKGDAEGLKSLEKIITKALK